LKSTAEILSAFERSAEIFRGALASYTEEQFAAKPDADSWSLGQMYFHLVNGTQVYHMRQISNCLAGSETGGKKLPGKIFFFIGSFPPVRVKVPPSEAYTPKQPADIAAMRDGLEIVIGKMRELSKTISVSESIGKAQHPAFGFLSALEWYQLIEMHFRHHLKQKNRLEKLILHT
jgi:hypothetical protein